jgi:hypothetical protein
MRTNAGAILTDRYQLQIIKAFRSERALSGQSARKLRELGVKDTEAFRGLIDTFVIRKAGPERFFLDEKVWVSQRKSPKWLIPGVIVALLVITALGLYLTWKH